MTPQLTQIAPVEADDLAGIMSAYTEVTERLRSSHERLAEEVARLRGELARKNQELERRSRLAALGQMAAGMAHEIRNPLGGIALYASLLVRQLSDRQEPRDMAEKIAKCVGRLDNIVNDILAFAGEIKPRKRNVLLSAIVAEASELAGGRLESTGAKLTCKIGRDLEFRADPALLVRALSNLLFNAGDAAGEGNVCLLAGERRRAVEISVRDSGPGIDKKVMDRLFNPFFTTKDMGTGLGLAIVHRIVDSHGGKIVAANDTAPEGLGGAKFTITLPIGELHT
ncbi:MAG: sensor histidine kinase [Planctomycetes bacterium]|nr:sensor histidine kinase [Planctomycetota bacterium]